MLKRSIRINSIPAIVWGEPSSKAYIFVHGKLSQKEEAERFAAIACGRGYQVLSFDLPEHGERKADTCKCTVQNGVHDLQEIGEYAAAQWEKLSLFGCSLGAYFSLMAYGDMRFDKALFLSPILDMERLIRNMMAWCNVSEAALEEKQEIPTPFGETLSWPYFEYVKEHPVRRWENRTSILYGTKDNLTERCVVEEFARRFQCDLELLENGEHYFHTKEQLEALDRWLRKNIL